MRYAVRNILRLKTRSFLTFAIAFAILFLSMFGTLIVRLCEDNRELFYGPLDGSIHVTNAELSPFLSYDVAVGLNRASEEIEAVSAIFETPVHLDDVEYIGYGDYIRGVGDWENQRIPATAIRTVEYFEGFTICGVTTMDILDEVYSGELTMKEGTMISRDNTDKHANKIVISASVAEKNGLSIGDTVYLDCFSLFREETEARILCLVYSTESTVYPKDNYYRLPYLIGGIYEHKTDNTISSATPDLINENKVYVPISTLADIAKSDKIRALCLEDPLQDIFEIPTIVPDHLYFHLSDIDRREELEAELNTLGLKDTVKLTPYLSDAATSPSARLSEIVSTLLVGVIVFGFAILVLAVLFHMKARHRELAVLAALGKERRAITNSFFAELLVLILAALVCGGVVMTAAVIIFAAPIGTYLYSAEISAHISTEDASFLFGDNVQNTVASQMEDGIFLFTRYVIPGFAVSLLACVLILGVLYLIVSRYIHGINALSGVGGKE